MTRVKDSIHFRLWQADDVLCIYLKFVYRFWPVVTAYSFDWMRRIQNSHVSKYTYIMAERVKIHPRERCRFFLWHADNS